MLHKLLSWDDATEKRLEQIEEMQLSEAHSVLLQWEAEGLAKQDVYLLLALAAARWVNHTGPFIGHGTFNGGPVLRANSILSPRYRVLALLHMMAYVLDLLKHPNYGPYLMLERFALPEDPDTTLSHFIPDLESGEKPLLSEHRVAQLANQSLQRGRWLMLWAAMRQYPENEHRLLIVERAFELLDDSQGWRYAEAFYRAAIQYLGNRPQAGMANQVLSKWPGESCPEYTGAIDIHVCDALLAELMACEFGEESEILIDSYHQHTSAETMKEAMALASSSLLYSSGFDAHAVTGIHGVLDLLENQHLPSYIRHLGWAIGLSTSRTRRQKENRAAWIANNWKPTLVGRFELDQVVERTMHDPSGRDAATSAKQFLLSGGDPTQLTRALMEVSLSTSDPFDAIHNVKMLWGLLSQTTGSRWPQRSWIHLTAGTVVVAMSVNSSGLREDIKGQWEQMITE